MTKISAARFKQECLAILDSVGPEGVIITKRGKPVAKLVPIEKTGRSLIGKLKGRIRIKGNILSTGSKWDVES